MSAQQTPWYVLWEPDDVRKIAPDFARPMSEGPFLIFVIDGAALVFGMRDVGDIITAYLDCVQQTAAALKEARHV